MKLMQVQGICAVAASVLFVLSIVVKHRRLTLDNVGQVFAVFVAASSLPMGLVLCSCILLPTFDVVGVPIPDVYALYVSAAGMMLFLASSITIGKLFYGSMAAASGYSKQPSTSEVEGGVGDHVTGPARPTLDTEIRLRTRVGNVKDA